MFTKLHNVFFKRVNIEAQRKVAEDHQMPFSDVYLAAVVQAYFGELDQILRWNNRVFLPSFLLISILAGIAGNIGLLSFAVCYALIVVGICSHIEMLYANKGSAFMSSLDGLVRSSCRDKSPLHREANIDELLADVKKANQSGRDE